MSQDTPAPPATSAGRDDLEDRDAPRRSVGAALRLVRGDPAAFLIGLVWWTIFWSVPLAAGWFLTVALSRVDVDPRGGFTVWHALVAMGAVEAVRWLGLLLGVVQWNGAWVGWNTVPRVNMLRSVLLRPGPATGRLPSSSGEAVSRFRDDTFDLALVCDVWLDVTGAGVASVIGLAVLSTVDLRATLVAALPVAVTAWAVRAMAPRLRAWRLAARRATAAVTGFVGDTFGGILALRTAGAEDAVLERFRALNRHRAVRAHRDQVATAVMRSLASAVGEAGIGLVLLALAFSARRRAVSVGEVALFASYVTVIGSLPRWVASLGTYQRQADVSVARLAELTPGDDPLAPAAPVPIHLRTGPPPLEAPPVRDGHALVELRAEGLTARHEQGGGIDRVDLVVRRGEVVVVTGEVGAGKSTLLRAVLGLVAASAGTVSWNGRPVDEPSEFLVPPRAAYVPQVPRLFSEPLADAILLGWPDGGSLWEAVRLACLDADVTAMPEGLATVVGTRGVRLSGGQVQRAAAARALVREPDLLVVDDLSSALDTATEAELWRRVLGRTGATVLAVSHRPAVHRRADRVLVVQRGRVVEVRER
ncbi:MAG: ABC transporter ATP-binding protein [Actinobacteria bacterium]|nr:ABC transporter ATP-binding protein [Actinomycetota bacterium]